MEYLGVPIEAINKLRELAFRSKMHPLEYLKITEGKVGRFATDLDVYKNRIERIKEICEERV